MSDKVPQSGEIDPASAADDAYVHLNQRAISAT
jgi:hypothetical protein